MNNLKDRIPNHIKAANHHYSQIKPWVSKSLKIWELLVDYWLKGISKKTLQSQLNSFSTTQSESVKFLFNIAAKKSIKIDQIRKGIFRYNSFKPELLKNSNEIKKIIKDICLNLNDILIGLPASSYLISSQINSRINSLPTVSDEIHNFLNYIFSFDRFSRKAGFKFNGKDNYGAYQLTSRLKIDICPFCDINFTYTVIIGDRKIIRPNLDHFYPKSSNPILQLSFYNLIPCCNTCNSSLKKNEETNPDEYLHPYDDGYESATSFMIFPKSASACLGFSDQFSLHLIPKNNISSSKKKQIYGNKSMFAIDERYNYHKNFVQNLLAKSAIIDTEHIHHIRRIFLSIGQNITKKQAISFYFGDEQSQSRKSQEPLRKLRQDFYKKNNY